MAEPAVVADVDLHCAAVDNVGCGCSCDVDVAAAVEAVSAPAADNAAVAVAEVVGVVK